MLHASLVVGLLAPTSRIACWRRSITSARFARGKTRKSRKPAVSEQYGELAPEDLVRRLEALDKAGRAPPRRQRDRPAGRELLLRRAGSALEAARRDIRSRPPSSGAARSEHRAPLPAVTRQRRTGASADPGASYNFPLAIPKS